MKKAFAVLTVVLTALVAAIAADTTVTINYTIGEVFNFSVICTKDNTKEAVSEFGIVAGQTTLAFDLCDTTVCNAAVAKSYRISASASNWTNTNVAPVVTLTADEAGVKDGDNVRVNFDGTEVVDNSADPVKVADVNVQLNNENLLAGTYSSTITFTLTAI